MTESDLDWLPRLASLFSPAFPVGAYSYSHGLEQAVETGAVCGRSELRSYIGMALEKGAGWSDLVIVAHTWRAAAQGDFSRCAEVAEIARALRPTAEFALETTQQGTALAAATLAAWPGSALESAPRALLEELAYPVAVGLVCSGFAPLTPTLIFFAQAFAANLVSAGVRLIPLGQTEGQKTTADLMATVLNAARRASCASLDDLGSATPAIEIASMRHETQYTRLFRS